MLPSRRRQRRLVHEIRQVGADHPGRRRCDPRQIDIGRERNVARVHAKNRLPTRAIRRLHGHPAVEPARPEQSLVEHVGTVVAAITITLEAESKPSISVRI
jgi:hypothetical protein